MVLLVQDAFVLYRYFNCDYNIDFKDEWKEQELLIANYNANTEEEKLNIDKIFTDEDNSELFKELSKNNITLDGMTKIVIIESSKGVATIVIFIAIYLGIIFLIASSAILALKPDGHKW